MFSRCFCILCCSGYLNKNHKRFTPKGPQEYQKAPTRPQEPPKGFKRPLEEGDLQNLLGSIFSYRNRWCWAQRKVKQRATVCLYVVFLRPSRPGWEHRFRARGRGAIARCHCAPWRRCVQERSLFSRCFCILCCSGYLNKNHKRFTPKGPQEYQKAPTRPQEPPKSCVFSAVVDILINIRNVLPQNFKRATRVPESTHEAPRATKKLQQAP